MDKRDRRLRRELIVLVILKLAVLTAIWWLFIRDVRVAVDESVAARHFTATSRTTAQGDTDAQ